MPLSGSAARLPWKTPLRIVLLVLLIVAANFVAAWLASLLKFEVRPSNEDLVHRAIMTAAIVYAVVMAIPFVPGVEIGLSLVGMLGPPIVFLVYVSTVAGLSLSFVIGRIISLRRLINLFETFQLKRASGLVGVLEPMSSEERLAFLVSKAPNRWRRWRYSNDGGDKRPLFDVWFFCDGSDCSFAPTACDPDIRQRGPMTSVFIAFSNLSSTIGAERGSRNVLWSAFGRLC